MHDPCIGHVQANVANLGRFEAVQSQRQGFQIGLKTRMTINFGTKLEWFAGRVGTIRAGVQNGSAVAQTGHAFTVEQVCVDACHLGRAVGPQPHHASGQLIHELESLEVKRLTGA